MNHSIHRKSGRWFYLGVLMVCAIVANAQAPQQTASSAFLAGATVTEWKGKVQLQLQGKAVSSPYRGELLAAGTQINTGDGRLLLQLRDGTEVLVRSKTRLILKEPNVSDWSYFELLLGRILTHVTKRTGGAPPFKLATPSAVISVRGTRFEVEVNRHSITEVDVFDGLVEVAGVKNSELSVTLGPGFSTRVGLDGVPEAERPTEEIRPESDRADPQGDSEQHLGVEGEQEAGPAEPAGEETAPNTNEAPPGAESPSAESPTSSEPPN